MGAGRTGRDRRAARLTAVRAGAALAVAMGVGRFVLTPILPLMQTEAGLGAQGASTLVTSDTPAAAAHRDRAARRRPRAVNG